MIYRIITGLVIGGIIGATLGFSFTAVLIILAICIPLSFVKFPGEE